MYLYTSHASFYRDSPDFWLSKPLKIWTSRFLEFEPINITVLNYYLRHKSVFFYVTFLLIEKTLSILTGVDFGVECSARSYFSCQWICKRDVHVAKTFGLRRRGWGEVQISGESVLISDFQMLAAMQSTNTTVCTCIHWTSSFLLFSCVLAVHEAGTLFTVFKIKMASTHSVFISFSFETWLYFPFSKKIASARSVSVACTLPVHTCTMIRFGLGLTGWR